MERHREKRMEEIVKEKGREEGERNELVYVITRVILDRA